MELIRITEKDGQKVVSARELHAFLESKKDFSSWIKHRIKKYGLIENTDFTVLPQMGEPDNQKVKIEYALTVDAAKELSMVEGNARGKQARQYFIECERKANAIALPSKKELAIMVVRAEEEKERLLIANELQASQLKAAAPKVQYCEEVLQSASVHTATSVAKELGMSAKTFNQALKDRGIQYFHDGRWQLYAKYQDKDYTRTRTYTYTDAHGNTQTSVQTVWTEKGRAFIHYTFKMKAA